MIVSPSLLASDFLNLESEIKKLNTIKDIWLHLDIMDGHFVPNLTFGHEFINRIAKLSANPCDAHFMVQNPDFYINSLDSDSIHNFTFHIETSKEPIKLVNKIKKKFKSVGISLKPNTPVSDLSLDILKLLDLVLVMSVEPGFGGQSFIPSSTEKIKELHKLKIHHKLKYQIQVDGGVNESNARRLIEAGATNLVAGSFVFKNKNYQEQINLLTKLELR